MRRILCCVLYAISEQLQLTCTMRDVMLSACAGSVQQLWLYLYVCKGGGALAPAAKCSGLFMFSYSLANACHLHNGDLHQSTAELADCSAGLMCMLVWCSM